MTHYELTIHGNPLEAVQAIANAGIKLTAHSLGTGGNRLVLDAQGANKARELGIDISCITPVLVVPFQNRPGGLASVLERYRNFDILATYAGADNHMVIKLADSCLHFQ